jgi:hypothetical protein
VNIEYNNRFSFDTSKVEFRYHRRNIRMASKINPGLAEIYLRF